ncbi:MULTISPECIES: heavy metal translocating P-type ATPase [Bacteroides]|uniref:heavy metal translocating P-type ATPase n=1 Tax=Bacteroides TaxID=816 RepID=UPI000E43841B|nr:MULTISPECIES: heavy metal translocating P-type ATPase [Bacteroides]MBS7574934.1 cadmium-translocating P-type ATPase [Bacteroides propionicigenes]RGM30016.1 cadmium-translocating P-type ATPase [Bacteroides sp. OM08-17BH]RHJ52960.1 cadmium-translocating P-type ATPase [Bacteroides sp. AM10-21B]HBO05176.1 cadmium-translocating P-type ATPase [Bacteroides sp.]
MGHHNCTCCCAHDNAQPKNAPGNIGFLKEYWKILLSALLLFGGIAMKAMNLSFFSDDAVVLVWYLLAYLPVGLPVLKEAWESILQKDIFSEFTLMSIATLGAFYIKEYPEGVAVMLFYSLGELFQDKAVSKAKQNISALLDVRPETATVIRGNEAFIESPRNVQVGDIIEVKTGERVPLDGTMLGETAAFNTSALTGESVPRTIRKGEEVLAGMIATDKVVRVKVTKPFEKSALSRILELVQNASERKAPAELFIRKFARIYTPIVTGLAVLIVLLPFLYSLANTQFIFTFDDWLYRALVFLVISCPCALVVSIPLGYFGGIGAASRLGVLFKGGNYLDAITKVNTVVFDKTGTLTKGTFEVQACHTQHGTSEKKLIQIIASAERNSTHPIAKAITGYAEQRQIPFAPAAEVTEIAGHGLETKINGQHILVGNTRLLSKYNVEYPQKLSTIADTVVVCAIDSAYAGYLLLSDTLKEDARKAIKDLKALNINNIQILSGDKQAIVTNFAEKLGITQAYGDLLPDGKVEHIEKLRQDADNRIAFVGDGINDAPVLALSHVGIAMGGLGSDAAIETADVVIQTDQPSKVATAIRVGKQTHRIVWQNISLAFGVKLSVLILGAGGLATLWEAVFADVGVALIAIVNAIRIQKLIK